MQNKSFMWLTLLAIVFSLGLGVSESEAQSTHKNCASEISPVAGSFNPSEISNIENLPQSQILNTTCFATEIEAIRFATHGRVNLPTSTSRVEINRAIDNANQDLLNSSRQGIITPQTTYVIIQVFENVNWGGGNTIYYSSSVCSSSYAFYQSSLPGWNDKISSAKIFSPCTTAYWYDLNNYGGTWGYCVQPCYGLGAMDNKAASMVVQ